MAYDILQCTARFVKTDYQCAGSVEYATGHKLDARGRDHGRKKLICRQRIVCMCDFCECRGILIVIGYLQ